MGLAALPRRPHLAIHRHPPPDRRIDSALAGIPGGIPSRMTVCATVDAARFGDGRMDATAAIQDALDACPAGEVVYLPAGTYVTSETINMRTDKTLRVAPGQGRTIVRYEGPGMRSVLDMRGSVYSDVFNRKRTYTIVGGVPKDATALAHSAMADIVVGDVLLVDQRNDGVLVDHVGSEGPCTYCRGENGTRARGKLVEVVGVGDGGGGGGGDRNTVRLSLPLFFDLDPWLSPQAVLVPERSMVRRAGVEDLILTQAEPVNDFIVEMDGAQQCWLKGVEVTGMKRRGIWHIESLQNEIRDGTIHGAVAGYGRDRGYGLQLDLQSTANLVENNVVHDVDGGGIMTSGGAIGNVIGYNHLPDIRFDDPWWLIGGPSLNHSAHPSMNLWEGNVGPQISGDFIHGSASHQTFFPLPLDQELEGRVGDVSQQCGRPAAQEHVHDGYGLRPRRHIRSIRHVRGRVSRERPVRPQADLATRPRRARRQRWRRQRPERAGDAAAARQLGQRDGWDGVGSRHRRPRAARRRCTSARSRRGGAMRCLGRRSGRTGCRWWGRSRRRCAMKTARPCPRQQRRRRTHRTRQRRSIRRQRCRQRGRPAALPASIPTDDVPKQWVVRLPVAWTMR